MRERPVFPYYVVSLQRRRSHYMLLLSFASNFYNHLIGISEKHP